MARLSIISSRPALGLVLLVASLSLAACHGSSNEEPDLSYTTLVTYEGTDTDLQVSTFSYQVIDDSPLITLTANWLPTTELTPGERVMLVYLSDTYGKSGPVTVKRVAPVIGWKPARTAKPLSGNVSITPITYWRSGPYLNANIEAIMTRDAATATFALLESTEQDPMPTYYLAVSQSDIKEVEAIRRMATISFDISASWDRPDCTGIKVIYRDIHNREASLIIEK